MAQVVSSLSWTLLNLYMPQNNCFGIRIQLNIQKDKWNLWERHQNNKGPLLENCYFPTSCWGQLDLHTPDLWLTTYPLYAFSTWESIKISYLRKIGLRCIHINLTTTAYIDGFTQEIGDHLRFQISVDCSVSRSLREDLFTTCMLDFSINELFQVLGGD